MSKPTTPLDSEIAKIFGNNTRIFRAMRELFKQAGDLSPAEIEDALITGGNAGTAANQALDAIERLTQAVELIALMPRDIDNIPNTLADLAPRSEEDQTVLREADIGVSVQAFSADLDIYAANPLTVAELGQLQNIDAVTISTTQWGFLGVLNQNLRTIDDVTFNKITTSDADINGGTIDGTIIGGSVVAAGSFAAIVGTTGTLSGILSVTDITGSTSTTTGSGVFAGGLGVAENISTGGFYRNTSSSTISLGAIGNEHRFQISSNILNLNNSSNVAVCQWDLLSTFKFTSFGPVSVNNTGATINSGTGSPEGVVTANVGSIFMRTDGGASTTLFVKESGTGNTGWIAK